MEFKNCPTCKELCDAEDGTLRDLITAGSHTCPPQWRVFNPEFHGDDYDDADSAFERTAEAALEKWASGLDFECDPAVTGHPLEAYVWRQGEDPRESGQHYFVAGELAPVYRVGPINTCPSCHRRLDSIESTHGCPRCDHFVCNECKVDDEGEMAPCTGTCKRCRGHFDQEATDAA